MELSLDLRKTDCFKPLKQDVLCCEEGLEVIIPDSYPDVDRIIDVFGQIRLTGKNLSQGVVQLSGVLDGWIIYEPEGDRDVCRVSVCIPFSMTSEDEQIGEDCRCSAIPVLDHLEYRVMNPRKVSVRARFRANMTLCCPSQLEFCSGAAEAEANCLEQKTMRYDSFLIRDMQEKEFTVYDEIRSNSLGSGSGEIISSCVSAHCTHAKVIGNKLIIKGEARVNLRVLFEGRINCIGTTIAFSQAIDVHDAGEGADCRVDLCITGLRVGDAMEAGRPVEVAVDILAQAIIRETVSLQLLCDAYSTSNYITSSQGELCVDHLVEHASCVKSICQTLETTIDVRSILDCTVYCVRMEQCRQNASVCLEAEFAVKALCLDDSLSPVTVDGAIVVTGQLEDQPLTPCELSCRCLGDVFAAPVTNGIEVRFEAEFQWLIVKSRSITYIRSIREEEAIDHGDHSRGSIILKPIVPEESLWAVGKQYCTSCSAIRQANNLEEDQIPSSGVLLVPRV